MKYRSTLMNSETQFPGLITAAFLLLSIFPADRSLAHPPVSRPATMPIIPQKDSPIQFEVKFWPTGAILAGESVTMELTLRNSGTQPYRIPIAVPQIYETRINLEFDLPSQPIFDQGNVFYSALDLSPERHWPAIRQWITMEPGESHVVKSIDIFAEASSAGSGQSAINAMDKARIRVLVFLDDGNFVASDWVDFKIEQPQPKEEGWHHDVVDEYEDRGGRMISRRTGLLRHHVDGTPWWFVAYQSDGHPFQTDGDRLRLFRLPMTTLRQVIPVQRSEKGTRNIAVLGDSDSGEWFIYHSSSAHPGEPLRSLGTDKRWRLELDDAGKIEVVEDE